jgi:hypothetical protein
MIEPLVCLNEWFKMCECFKNGNGRFRKWVKNWVDRMDVCVRSMGELVPMWLGMWELSILSLKDHVA